MRRNNSPHIVCRLQFVFTLVAFGLLCGCANFAGKSRVPAPAPPVDQAAIEGSIISSYLDTLLKLASGSAAEQAEILAKLQSEQAAAPTPSRLLRYGLALSTPGHNQFDPVGAQRLLREVLASPETLLPAERALAYLQLSLIDRYQALQSEVKRTQAETDRSERDRVAQLNRRLTAESEENARLKRQLEDAQAKLDAISRIEQTMKNRTSQPEGRTP
ncbi:MAG: hypothetical protein R3E72_02710 [Steroidobacteraceae bacterium]